jgi:hypothetical protein
MSHSKSRCLLILTEVDVKPKKTSRHLAFTRLLPGQFWRKRDDLGLFLGVLVVKGSPLTYSYGFFGHNSFGLNHGSLFI